MLNKRNLLESLVLVSEKAANIARAIRHEKHLLSLLIREKKGFEKNPRFAQDFKTLADVLVQEVVKYDLGNEYPCLRSHIFGEESNEFTSLDGTTLHLNVGNSKSETSEQLLKVLGDETTAELLATHVHSSVDIADINLANLPPDLSFLDLPLDELGIWIDPIDSTAEYINGVYDLGGEVSVSGLPCVTVLIGAFHRPTGVPVAGVINQPFHTQVDNRWQGRCVWGVSWNGKALSSLPEGLHSRTNKVMVSSSEDADIKQRLASGDLTLIEAAGAGYKLLCVILGTVDAYVLSKGSTYWWDTCSPAAILKAQGGGVVDYFLAMVSSGDVEVKYKEVMSGDECCNKCGVIAYRDREVLDLLVSLLKEYN